jgi:hypothetical protein
LNWSIAGYPRGVAYDLFENGRLAENPWMWIITGSAGLLLGLRYQSKALRDFDAMGN